MKFLVPFFLVFPFILFSQNTNRKFIASTELKDGIQITVSDGNYYFYSYNQKVIEFPDQYDWIFNMANVKNRIYISDLEIGVKFFDYENKTVQ